MKFNVSFSLSDEIKNALSKSLSKSSVSILVNGVEIATLTPNSPSASIRLDRGEYNVTVSSCIDELGMSFAYESIYKANVNDDFDARIGINAREYKLTMSVKDVMSRVKLDCIKGDVKRERLDNTPFINSDSASLADLIIENRYLVNTFLHIFLLLATCGVWFAVWVYRVTCFTNTLPSEHPYRNPTTRALLCLFVPFYFVCWSNETAHRIDKIALYCDVPSDVESAWHICMFYLSWLMPVIIQIKINQIVRKTTKKKFEK
jgi:hypothetical protein